MTGLTPEKRAELRAKAIALKAISGGGPDRERAFKQLHLELTEEVVLSLLDALDEREREIERVRAPKPNHSRGCLCGRCDQ